MIKSMTAYGRGEFTQNGRAIVAEIRSVNNRYRDVVLRIPKSLQSLEDEIRSQIASRVRRGRVEAAIQMKKDGAETEYSLELNLPLVRSYFQIFKQLSEEFGLDQKVGTDYLCQIRDVILVKPEEVDIDDVKAAIQEVLQQALDSLDVMRLMEGEAIEEDFRERLRMIEEYLGDIEDRAPIVIEDYRKRLVDKVEHLTVDLELDENRLLQEVAIFGDRCDITEEIVRGRSHLKQFRHYLSLDDAVGRKLDFLMQEIFREVNTIGAKANDFSISAKVVEIKSELEKLREQIQNVE